MANLKLPLLFRNKPLFGLDIGHGSLKLVQLAHQNKKTILAGYGTKHFEPKSIKDGEIIDFETVAKAAHKLIEDELVGSISSNRIAASLPVLHSFSRIISLPHMEEKDILEAVRLEAEQYIPIPINDLYLDYQLVEKTSSSQEFLVAAASKRVVDSYINLFNILGLDLVCLEPSILSVTRTVQQAETSDVTTLVIDCGSVTTDLIIYNKSAVRITGTIKFGGDALTEGIMNKFGVDYKEASRMKSEYGLDPGKHQARMAGALAESLGFLSSEIKKIITYFEERTKDPDAKVKQIIILGGGANLPGFSTYLTSELRIPTRLASIWQHIDTKHLKQPDSLDSSMYATAAGLAHIKPQEAAKQ